MADYNGEAPPGLGIIVCRGLAPGGRLLAMLVLDLR